jgi:hypothetical protein
MRGGVLPPALLFAALGLALGCARQRARAASLLGLLAGIGLSALVTFSGDAIEYVFLACWISIIVTAASVHLVRGPSKWVAIALSLNAGLWATAVAQLSASSLELLEALPCVLIMFPTAMLVRRGASIPVKVVSSWIIAIAGLSAALQLLPVTPGYLPDHLE